jgi:uncharacterized iron-regulated protein
VGEQHDNPAHSRAQLAIIKSLRQSGAKVALGLEMFRRESQEQLDRWAAGETR